MKEFKPTNLHIIRDLDTAKAIADPLRLQIIEVLLNGPLTVKQISKKLGLAASRLYYHVNTLEKHDLIRVVDTSIHGNLIEKHYWVSAYNYRVDHDVYNINVQEAEGKENIISMALNSLDLVREDFSWFERISVAVSKLGPSTWSMEPILTPDKWSNQEKFAGFLTTK
jgi:DNA-binding transcriptional ArsR family regulator